MVCRPRPEPAPARPARRRPAAGLVRLAMGVGAAALLVCPPVLCDERVLVGGLFDAEYWKTDDGSRLLSRNGGDGAAGRNLRLWAVGAFHPRLQGFVMGEVEAGRAYGENETELEQAYLRATLPSSHPLTIAVGQMIVPIGNFSRRYLSNLNPLVGSPNSYSTSYPLGLQVSGGAARLDYRVALMDRPFVNEAYVPAGGRALRPALAIGVTPFVGMRLGAYATRGPYLGPAAGALLPPGERWKDFDQSVYGIDLQFSRGYFELNGDVARSAYDAPGAARPLRGLAWFVEPKYTWSPRFFTALRLERNDYPYIQPLGPGIWLATSADVYDLEIGAGYRIAPGTLLKTAWRRDRWMVGDAQKSFFPDGYSLSVQLSCTFNLNSWFVRPR